MAAPETQQTCFVSGTSGYLGSRIKSALQRRGWRVVELTRRPSSGSKAVQFQLGTDLPSSTLAGAHALVHCAYDFTPLSWPNIHRVNVAGSERLLRAAHEAGVENLIYISSISAFEGCRSLYGRAKLATERAVQPLGATVIRPGLIWGELPGAMFKRLVDQVEHARMLPLLGGGSQIQHLVHEQDLVGLICGWAERSALRGVPITIAHEQPWTLRQILEEIARANGKRMSFLPVPWRLVWLITKTAELCGVRLPFRSDSVISLMNQNPTPSFAPQRDLNLVCRPFRMEKPPGC